MKQRSFFKKLGIGTAALVVAPKILAGIVREEEVVAYNKTTEWMPEDGSHIVLPTSDLLVKKAKLGEDGTLIFEIPHKLQPNDYITISNSVIESNYIVTSITDKFTITLVGMNFSVHPLGDVNVFHFYRGFISDDYSRIKGSILKN